MSILGAILASVASSLIGGAISKSANSKPATTPQANAKTSAGTTFGAVGSQVASSAIESYFRDQQAKKENRFKLDQWNRQNAYNTPAEQRRRLEEAGLNPALMYASGGVSNTAGLLSTSADQQLKGGDQLDLVGKQLSLAQTQANVEYTRTQSRLTEEDIRVREREVVLREIEQMTKQLEYINKEIETESNQEKLDILRAQKADLIDQIRLQNDKLRADTDAATNQALANWATAFERYEQGKTNKKQRSVMDAQIQQLSSQVGLNKAQALHFSTLVKKGQWDLLKEKYNTVLRHLGVDPDNKGWIATFQRIWVMLWNKESIQDVFFNDPSLNITYTDRPGVPGEIPPIQSSTYAGAFGR